MALLYVRCKVYQTDGLDPIGNLYKNAYNVLKFFGVCDLFVNERVTRFD